MFNLLFQSRDWEPIIVSTQLWGKAAFDVTNAKHNFPTQLWGASRWLPLHGDCVTEATTTSVFR